jgi:hypothetical protein
MSEQKKEWYRITPQAFHGKFKRDGSIEWLPVGPPPWFKYQVGDILRDPEGNFCRIQFLNANDVCLQHLTGTRIDLEQDERMYTLPTVQTMRKATDQEISWLKHRTIED